MTTKVCECKGCHRNLFSYEEEKKEKGKRFSYECPMCGKKGRISISEEHILYDKFLTDPKLKGKTEAPKDQLPPPPPGLGQEGVQGEGPTISLQIAVNPPESLSASEQFVLQELLNAAMGQFQLICQSGQADVVAAKMQAYKRQMESGVWTPDAGMPGGGCGPGEKCGFPENL